jgi:type IV pilus assembly protein PilA
MLNLKRRIAEARKSDEGFTLIELAVVILIIGILLLLAIPSFLGVRKKANDKAAQSALRVFLTGAKATYGDSESYAAATAASLAADEPGYEGRAAGTASTGPKTISVSTNATVWAAASLSKSNKCFYIADSVATGTSFGSVASDTTGTSCTGTLALAASGQTW